MTTLATAHKDIQAAADRPEIMRRLLNHGNPAVRVAANRMQQIAELHRRGDYSARCHQIAEDALFCLPIAEIERIQAEVAQ